MCDAFAHAGACQALGAPGTRHEQLQGLHQAASSYACAPAAPRSNQLPARAHGPTAAGLSAPLLALHHQQLLTQPQQPARRMA